MCNRYDRPVLPRSKNDALTKDPLFIFHFCVVSPPSLRRKGSAFELPAILHMELLDFLPPAQIAVPNSCVCLSPSGCSTPSTTVIKLILPISLAKPTIERQTRTALPWCGSSITYIWLLRPNSRLTFVVHPSLSRLRAATRRLSGSGSVLWVSAYIRT